MDGTSREARAPAFRDRRGPWVRALASASMVAGLAAGACTCGSSVATRRFGELDVMVDAESGRIELARAGKVLLDVPVSRVGLKPNNAVFTMEFGMFNIAEDSAPVRFAQTLTLDEESARTGADGPVRFTLEDEDGGAFAQGEVAAIAGGAAVKIVGPGGRAQMLMGSACTFRHAIGLGGHTHDVDHVGQRVPLWVSEPGIGKTDTNELPLVWQVVGRRHTSSAPIPAFVADNGAAYVLRTPAFARMDMCATEASEVVFEAWSGEVVLEVYAGASPREAQARMVDALGRPHLPPPWALAPWNDAIFGSESVRAFARRLRELDIPSSAIWTEDFKGGGPAGGDVYRLEEDWGVDPVMYPDFDALVAEVRALGYQQLTYYNTFLIEGGDVFNEALDKGYAVRRADGTPHLFAGADKDFSPTGLLDLTNPDAVEFIQTFQRADVRRGVRGWMADFAEWQPVEDTLLASEEDPALTHNLYPLLWQQANRDLFEAEGVLDEAVAFVRSAWLGSQPLAQVIWAGDQRTSFDDDDGLPTIVPMGIGLAAVGFPFYTHDIAGYQSATNDPVDQELFFRWTTLGALSPVMRTHHGTHAYSNVHLLSNDETIAHWKRWAELRVRMYPYLRRLALDAVAPGGLPLWVPLPLLYPGDDELWGVMDEVMLGPALLVAPVVQKGALAREVVLPSTRVAPFFGGDALEGPARVSVDAPVGDIPAFIVAGGIIPMTAQPVDTLMSDIEGLDDLEDTEGDREVVVGLGAPGSFEEESGASYTLEGAGTVPPESSEPDGAVVVTGNSVVTGEGFTLTLTGHPDGRVTRVLFR